jgi:DNA-binding transcriptional MerR regulator/methylmalonyl-CoA mutase cobalamin-binding subunit
MYTIKQAAIRSGVAIETIRAWERRYGVVAPARTDSGYRLYDDEAIRSLDAMRRLVASGMPPSAAAVELRRRGLDVAPGAPFSKPAPAVDEADRLADVIVAGAAALDEAAVSAAIDEMFARGSFERVASEILFPALDKLGSAWAAGHVSVAGEHLASQVIQRRLGQIFDSAGNTATSRKRVLVGLPPGSRHELGALAFAIAARRVGLPVAYLGADLPVEDWLQAAQSARAVVVCVPIADDRAAAARVTRALIDNSDALVATGGGGAVDEPGVLRLPSGIGEAALVLKRKLAASR